MFRLDMRRVNNADWEMRHLRAILLQDCLYFHLENETQLNPNTLVKMMDQNFWFQVKENIYGLNFDEIKSQLESGGHWRCTERLAGPTERCANLIYEHPTATSIKFFDRFIPLGLAFMAAAVTRQPELLHWPELMSPPPARMPFFRLLLKGAKMVEQVDDWTEPLKRLVNWYGFDGYLKGHSIEETSERLNIDLHLRRRGCEHLLPPRTHSVPLPAFSELNLEHNEHGHNEHHPDFLPPLQLNRPRTSAPARNQQNRPNRDPSRSGRPGNGNPTGRPHPQ